MGVEITFAFPDPTSGQCSHDPVTQRNASPSTATRQTGRQRQVRGHQRLAVGRQLPQQTDAHADRLLDLRVRSRLSSRGFGCELERSVAGERQLVAARREADHAVPRDVAAGARGRARTMQMK